MWPAPVERVAAYLRAGAVDATVQEFPDGTTTVAAAATALGVDPSLIVKSLVFVCDGEAVFALVPGDRRGDEVKVAAVAGRHEARLASAEEVLVATGFEPGAVAPFPQRAIALTLVDHLLLRHDRVWVGGGSSVHMVGLSPADLARLTQALTADISAPR
jgi:Cys-tRNA(Pro)/Cys-tRNA(Cys) deacylase